RGDHGGGYGAEHGAEARNHGRPPVYIVARPGAVGAYNSGRVLFVKNSRSLGGGTHSGTQCQPGTAATETQRRRKKTDKGAQIFAALPRFARCTIVVTFWRLRRVPMARVLLLRRSLAVAALSVLLAATAFADDPKLVTESYMIPSAD